MTDAQQLVGAVSISGTALLMLATGLGAALGRYEADLQHAADKAAAERRRQAAQRRTPVVWPAEGAPLLPTPTPTRQLSDAAAPLTAVRPGPPGTGRHRKGKIAC